MRRLALAVAALGALCAPAAAEPAPASSAAAKSVVEELNRGLLGIMQNGKQLGFAGRRDQIGPVVEARYDFPFMAEKSVGSTWQQLDEPQRAQLAEALARLAIATYAGRFASYDGERFETLGVDDGGFSTLIVHSRIVEKNGQTTPLDYRMRQTGDGQWRIIDVLLNGTVSELALRRADWTAVIKRDGFTALMKALEQKISDQAQGKGET
ncbi:MAG TPA: ABC transporter substrate-binding protein [Myxococcota bacterium]|jgi:phospholipid transport system substrate-binding protein|nr:ABC transporter substrate-binding protein [Myxococcota bacterium]